MSTRSGITTSLDEEVEVEGAAAWPAKDRAEILLNVTLEGALYDETIIKITIKKGNK